MCIALLAANTANQECMLARGTVVGSSMHHSYCSLLSCIAMIVTVQRMLVALFSHVVDVL